MDEGDETHPLYYRLYRDPAARQKGVQLARMGAQPELDLAWRAGHPFKKPPAQPVRCMLDARGGPDLPDAFLAERIFLFSDRLIECLQRGGVDNLDIYQVDLLDSQARRVAVGYKAVNVIGLVAGMDQAASTYDPQSQVPMLEFAHLTIDEKKAGGLRLFRLGENPSFIIVSEAVKEALDPVDLVNVSAISLTDPAAY